MSTRTKQAALLMVDMSVEQVASLSPSRTKLIIKTIQQMLACDKFSVKIDSRLWLESDKESTLSRVYPEWGVTMGVPNSNGAALIPQLLAPDKWEFIPKKHYSSFVDAPLLMERLQSQQITDVFLVGINTDYCIFNTAMDSFSRGRFTTHVVEEGVGSISGSQGHAQGLAWIRAHLGADAVVSVSQVLGMLGEGES